MGSDLFEPDAGIEPRQQYLAPGAMLLRGFAVPVSGTLAADLQRVIARAPFRHMVTPGGLSMSVAMTNCGARGWVSDRTGYRYDPIDPDSGKPWLPMPGSFLRLAGEAARAAGFDEFAPDACLINRYQTGAKLSLHQDKDERDFGQPIVSVSLGVPATFLFGGSKRAGKTLRVPVRHGDVLVWGGPARLNYHGVLPVKTAHHPFAGAHRINLTLRRAA
ncbi:MAG TPA: DNA oxidative demethylase AlkB [Casimicrobiaceae bacterium]|jgi:alkylated DNA repair protein (DNA oxidative demethylase)|nr:DNA oxidative demethylase AlkB [Casimicrobiaceae bacterium]